VKSISPRYRTALAAGGRGGGGGGVGRGGWLQRLGCGSALSVLWRRRR